MMIWPLGLLLGIMVSQQVRWQRLFAAEGEVLSQQAELELQKQTLQVQLLKNLPALGFQNLFHDWTFLQFLQYFGNWDHRQLTGYDLADDYFEVMVERDPYHFDAYIFMSSTLSIYVGQPDRAVELQKLGLESLTPEVPPEAYFIWRQVGIDQILFLDDITGAIESHEMAAQWAAQSPDPRGEEDQFSLQKTADFLKTDPDNTSVQVNAWLQVLSSSVYEETQAIAIANIEALGYELQPVNDGYMARPKSAPTSDE
ncbi:MAG: hypothetical protein F6K00_09645 [Leptolyngbya sp. SIOISBB]|nr:hypothetical protein [Leptolyngbya sp. SIOISBB]